LDPSPAHASIVQTDGQTDDFIGPLAGMLTSLNIRLAPGRAGHIAYILLFDSLTITATQIYVKLDHFEIVFEFSSALVHRLLQRPEDTGIIYFLNVGDIPPETQKQNNHQLMVPSHNKLSTVLSLAMYAHTGHIILFNFAQIFAFSS
jgi:hypothetical protein